MGEADILEQTLNVCGKCKESDGVFLLRKQNRYCAQCLELSLVTKIRGAVKNKQGGLVGGEQIGLCVSGGASSLCAWYLLDKYISSPADQRRERRKVPFDMHVVHVKDLAQRGAYPDILQKMKYECTVEELSAEDLLYPGSSGKHMATLFDSVTDLTGKQDLENILLRRALIQKAKDCGWSHIFMCHTSDKKAAEAVAAAAKGQGYTLSGFSQTVETRENHPSIVYCMKNISLEEVECLSSSILGRQPGTAAKAEVDKKNIHDLATSFTALLQNSNPGGVSNIMSSIGKLDSARDDISRCPLCTNHLHAEELLASKSLNESYLLALCDSCKVGIFGCFSNESLIASEHALDVFSKLPMCIQEDIRRGPMK